jgi:hypothetical protein
MSRLTPDGTGSAAAALLAAGVGCAALGALALAADASAPLNRVFSVYPPSGALSGVTSVAILIWLASWFGLARLWRYRSIDVRWVSIAAFALLALGFALTFPPVMDALQGR